MIFENIRIALIAIWANKLRSILTTLGIIIGVASVIAVVSLVQGMEHNISKELQGVGSTYIMVYPDQSQNQGMVPKMPMAAAFWPSRRARML